VFWTGVGAGVLRAPSWTVWLPGRAIVFHTPAEQPDVAPSATAEPDAPVTIRIEGAVA
jgi:hypothetical protein